MQARVLRAAAAKDAAAASVVGRRVLRIFGAAAAVDAAAAGFGFACLRAAAAIDTAAADFLDRRVLGFGSVVLGRGSWSGSRERICSGTGLEAAAARECSGGRS